MRGCEQTKGQSVWDHGNSVFKYFCRIHNYLDNQDPLEDFRIPTWLTQYRQELLDLLPSQTDLYYYLTYHDCGKPLCKILDTNGKAHFPNHSATSAQVWEDLGGTKLQCDLMRMDMDIHQLRAEEVPEFASRPEAATLLLAGLAEIHSNAAMFGGIESTSFKIKFKQIDKRGAAICKLLFRDVPVLLV